MRCGIKFRCCEEDSPDDVEEIEAVTRDMAAEDFVKGMLKLMDAQGRSTATVLVEYGGMTSRFLVSVDYEPQVHAEPDDL